MTARTQSLLAFLTITLFAVPAWACGPTKQEMLGLFAMFVATVFGGLGAATMAVCGRRWNLRFWGWVWKSGFAFAAAQVGALLGSVLVTTLFENFGSDTQMVVVTTVPALTTLAYVLWIRTNRFKRAERRAAVESTDAA